jgi:hypothetical protein
MSRDRAPADTNSINHLPLVGLERAMGIEPTSEAWEASILPLYDARSGTNVAKPIQACKHGSHGPETNRVFQASCISQATYADFFAH